VQPLLDVRISTVLQKICLIVLRYFFCSKVSEFKAQLSGIYFLRRNFKTFCCKCSELHTIEILLAYTKGRERVMPRAAESSSCTNIRTDQQ